MSELQLVAWRDDLVESLAGWREPDGHLVPTEPDPVERERCRVNLRVAIDVLDRALVG